MKRYKHRLNLQLFAEGDAGGGQQASAPAAPAAPQTGTPAPQSTAAPVVTTRTSWPGLPNASANPLLQTQAPAATPNPGQPAPVIPQEPETLDFAGRKVPVVDPAIRDIHRDYTNLNRTYTETNQQLKAMQEQNNILLQQLQTLQPIVQQGLGGNSTAQQPQQQPQGPSAEEIKAFNEKVLETFYENPLEANKMLLQHPSLQSMIEQRISDMVNKQFEPIQRKEQMNMQYQQMTQKYQDFNDMIPAMKQAIEMFPDLNNADLERVYITAKGLSGQTQQAQPTFEQMLADPNYQQRVLQDPNIRNAIIQSHMQTVQQQQQAAPPVIAGQQGAYIPVAGGDRPKTMRDSTKAWLRSLGQ